MEVVFETKEESNMRREKAFLALSGEERISSFLRGMEQVSFFPTRAERQKNNNLIIILPNQDELGK